MGGKANNILLVGLVLRLGLGAAVGIGLGLVPLLRNSCFILTGRCRKVVYRVNKERELLFGEPSTGLWYWYDGAFVRSYGPLLHTTTCPQAPHSGGVVLEPTFAVNAFTLEPVRGPVCSLAKAQVEARFGSSKARHVWVRSEHNPTVFQLMKALRAQGVFTPPVADPAPETCSGHGQQTSAGCVCEPGYRGPRCGTRMCGGDQECGMGRCHAGVCECNPGWSGPGCDMQVCPGGCLGGSCLGGVCVCEPGFKGERCERRECAACVNGVCDEVTGVCECEPGWEGAGCSTKVCPQRCSGHGACRDGVCECEPGWQGVGCEAPVCPANCSYNGECDLGSGVCSCAPGWVGPDCATSVCQRGCCGHGQCEPDGSCSCVAGWGGPDCSEPDDPTSPALRCPSRG
jgi:hypothetical protein